jgi:PAS domain S-box-containing protein
VESAEVRRLVEENERLRAEVARLSARGVDDAEVREHDVRRALDALPALFFVLDAEGRFRKYRAGRASLAVPPEEFLGQRIDEVFPLPLSSVLGGAFARARETGELASVEYELTGLRVTGHYLADFVPLPEGHVAALVRDVTQQHHAASAVRASEARFRALIEQATDVLYLLDAGLHVTFWSPGATRALGWSPEEVLGRFGLEFIHPDDLAQMPPPDPNGAGDLGLLTYRVRHRDGSWRTLDAFVRNLLGDPAVAAVIVNARDVTEQRALEARYAESQKLESIGRLAGGVAHDFNNLLTVILSCGELLRDSIAANGPASEEDVREILGAGNRARELTQQLLAFARRQVIAPVVLDLNTLVGESEKLLRRLLGEDVTLVMSVEPGLSRVRCDPAQLQQVVVNLAVNARDAMPRGGRLEISTDDVLVDAGQAASLPGLLPGMHVRLTVRDDGPGLPPEVREHLFEPFFTTKEKGRGTGLGLATVYGIVNQSGGSIAVESALGRGTAFAIYLPRSDAEVLPRARASPNPRERGSETVLLVEDEPAVGAVTARILRGAGYRVLHAHDGAEALALAATEPCLHLLLTDVVMPGLDGRQVADAIGRTHVETRVLFVSGYTQEAIVHHGVVDAGVQFLAKPFTRDALLSRVRAVLQG